MFPTKVLLDIINSTLEFTPSLEIQKEGHEGSNADHSVAIGNIFRTFWYCKEITKYREADKFNHVRKHIWVYNWSSISNKRFQGKKSMLYGVSCNLMSKLLGINKDSEKMSIYKYETVERRLETIPNISRGCCLWKHNHWTSLPEVNKILEKQVIIGEAYQVQWWLNEGTVDALLHMLIRHWGDKVAYT